MAQLKCNHPNFTVKQYAEMAHKQGNRCAICGRWERLNTKRYLSVDHNHKTGQIRELLCNNCNAILGMSGDNIEILKNAIKYLKRKQYGTETKAHIHYKI